jgi:hypothetical protein
MWHALRAELAYYRSYLLGGLGLAVGVAALVSAVFWAVGQDGPPSSAASGIRAMFFIMAPLIVGYVAQGLRPEERRERLLLATPLTPGQIAGAGVLMSVVLLAFGILGAGLMLAAGALVSGRLEVESLNMTFYVGGIMFAILQIIPLGQEAAAARSQGRARAATLGWAGLALAIVLFTVPTVVAFTFQGSHTWPSMHLGNLLVALTATVTSVALYTGRNDFTR